MSTVIQVSAQCTDSLRYTVCSNELQVLEVASFLPNSAFQWRLDTTLIPGQTGSKLNVKKETTRQLVENYKCEVKKDGRVYETHYFVVTINPYTPITVQAGHLCEGEPGEFRLTTKEPYNSLEWTINRNFKSLNDTVYFLCGKNPLNVSLKMINQYGCSTTYTDTFEVNGNPGGNILKNQLVSSQYSMPNVDCGNTVSEYSINDLRSDASVVKWFVIYDGVVIKEISAGTIGKAVPYDKRFFEWMEIKDATTIRIKWTKTNQTYNLIIRATTSNGDCNFNTDFSTILISDFSPDADTLIQKPYPAKSDVLIFPSGQNRQDLNYQWGYTINPDTPNAIEKNIKGKRFFVEVGAPGLNPAYKYWVETWYSSNSFCRTRTYAEKITR